MLVDSLNTVVPSGYVHKSSVAPLKPATVLTAKQLSVRKSPAVITPAGGILVMVRSRIGPGGTKK